MAAVRAVAEAAVAVATMRVAEWAAAAAKGDGR